MSDKLSTPSTENLTAAVTCLLHEPLPESCLIPSHSVVTLPQGNDGNHSNKQQLPLQIESPCNSTDDFLKQPSCPVKSAINNTLAPIKTLAIPLSLPSNIKHRSPVPNHIRMPLQSVDSSIPVHCQTLPRSSTMLPSNEKVRLKMDSLVKSGQSQKSIISSASICLDPQTVITSDPIRNQRQVHKLLGQTIHNLNTPGSVQISQSLLHNLLNGISPSSIANTLLNNGKILNDDLQFSNFSQLSPTQPLQNLIHSMFPVEQQSSVQPVTTNKSQSLQVSSQENVQTESLDSTVKSSSAHFFTSPTLSSQNLQIPVEQQKHSLSLAGHSATASQPTEVLEAHSITSCVKSSSVEVPPTQQLLSASQPIPIIVQSTTSEGPLQVVPLTPGFDVVLLQQILQQAIAKPACSEPSSETRLSNPVHILPKPDLEPEAQLKMTKVLSSPEGSSAGSKQMLEKGNEGVTGSSELVKMDCPTSTVNTTTFSLTTHHTWSKPQDLQQTSSQCSLQKQQQQSENQQEQNPSQLSLVEESGRNNLRDSSFQSLLQQELQIPSNLFSHSLNHSILEGESHLLQNNAPLNSNLQLVLPRQQQHVLQTRNQVQLSYPYHQRQHLQGQVQPILSKQVNVGQKQLQHQRHQHEQQICNHVLLNEVDFNSSGQSHGLFTEHRSEEMCQTTGTGLSRENEDTMEQEPETGFTGQTDDMSCNDGTMNINSSTVLEHDTSQQSSHDMFTFCIDCNKMVQNGCEVHSTECMHIYDSAILSRARASLPSCLYLDQTTTSTFKDYHGVWCKECLSERTRFGPVIGRQVTLCSSDYRQQIYGFNPLRLCTEDDDETVVLQLIEEEACNWMMFVRMAHSLLEQNCILYMDGNQFFLITKTEIKENEELLFWFSADMCTDLGVSQNPGNLKLLQCPECGLYFTTQRSQNNHLKSSHPELYKRTYGCVICGKKFSANSKLNNHMMSHMGVKPHRCTYCQKHFSDPSNLKTHMHIHTGEKKYKCDECGKTFRQKAHLEVHQITHTGLKRYQCSFCQKLFSRQSDLKSHSYRHTQEFSYTCSTCGKVFYKTQNYKKHLKVHSGERNYMCNKCFKGFQTKYHRDRHLKICKEKNGKESSYMSLEEVAKLDNTCDVVLLKTVKGADVPNEQETDVSVGATHDFFSAV